MLTLPVYVFAHVGHFDSSSVATIAMSIAAFNRLY